jgi:hypothetical protein
MRRSRTRSGRAGCPRLRRSRRDTANQRQLALGWPGTSSRNSEVVSLAIALDCRALGTIGSTATKARHAVKTTCTSWGSVADRNSLDAPPITAIDRTRHEPQAINARTSLLGASFIVKAFLKKFFPKTQNTQIYHGNVGKFVYVKEVGSVSGSDIHHFRSFLSIKVRKMHGIRNIGLLIF